MFIEPVAGQETGHRKYEYHWLKQLPLGLLNLMHRKAKGDGRGKPFQRASTVAWELRQHYADKLPQVYETALAEFLAFDDPLGGQQPEAVKPAPQAPESPAPLLPPSDDKTAQLARLLAELAGKGTVDAGQVRQIVKEEFAALSQPQAPAEIYVNGAITAVIEESRHPLFEKVLRLTQAGLNVLLVGPAGCGKTYLTEQIAKALQRSYGTVHCTAGMSESHVSGWLLPTEDNGRFTYKPAEFVTAYAGGNSLFLLDEIDAADPNVLMFLNGALANGALHIPHRLEGSKVLRGERVSIMAAANTFGHGADSRYQGRNALDGATLDRFYTVVMDYNPALEAQIMGAPYKPGKDWTPAETPTAQEIQTLGQWVQDLRSKVNKAGLRRIVSTRTVQKAITARQAGIPTTEVKSDILAGWTPDELSRCGV